MALLDDLKDDVSGVINQTWDIRDGNVVPDTASVKLAGGAVKLNATFLYADLADSTGMAMKLDVRVAAKIARAFLATCSRLINHHGGAIRSFDGDRVMGIFVGGVKNTSAVKCALQIRYVFREVLRPAFEKKYTDLAKIHTLAYAAGVDTSDVMAVRGGIRNNNDLVWIGRAPNIAAKLSNIRRTSAATFITPAVYNNMKDSSKFGGEPKRNMWTKASWKGEVSEIYESGWQWKP